MAAAMASTTVERLAPAVLPETLAQTRVHHRVQEVSADKAYLARYNLAATAEGGADPFILLKTDSVGMESPSAHWRKMWCLFQLKADEFLRSYHRRSNVESAIGSIKARCGGLVRSRVAAAKCNEVLAKVLLHNLACVVARLTDVSIDDLLAGALLSPRTCPHCGRPPDDFADEETVVEDRPRAVSRSAAAAGHRARRRRRPDRSVCT